MDDDDDALAPETCWRCGIVYARGFMTVEYLCGICIAALYETGQEEVDESN